PSPRGRLLRKGRGQLERHLRERRFGRGDEARLRRRAAGRAIQAGVLLGGGVRQMAGTRNYQSIGEVLVSVKAEFPDITSSKIRFLEAEGLIEPERTPSGYRKFYVQDVERLKSILRMQRDEYLPLKVIKERLLHGGEGEDDAFAGADGDGQVAAAEELADA